MKILKLQILTSGEGDSEQFTDLYFDVDTINGFFIPVKSEKDTEEGEAINILFHGDAATVKQEEHIVHYLKTKFVDKAEE